jgi:hypothetical protein
MFEVLNADNVVCFKTEAFAIAKAQAEKMKADLGENFTVWEIKQVYVTQTLDEALKPRTLADRPRVPPNFKD